MWACNSLACGLDFFFQLNFNKQYAIIAARIEETPYAMYQRLSKRRLRKEYGLEPTNRFIWRGFLLPVNKFPSLGCPCFTQSASVNKVFKNIVIQYIHVETQTKWLKGLKKSVTNLFYFHIISKKHWPFCRIYI